MNILDNLNHAMSILTHIPEDKMDLEIFRVDTDCGTIACAAGHLASTAYFQELGMELVPVTLTTACRRYYLAEKGTINQHKFLFLNEIFGTDAFHRLFEVMGDGLWDHSIAEAKGYGYSHPHYMTDKELVLERFRRQIQIYEDIAP